LGQALGEVAHRRRQFACGPPNCSSSRLARAGLGSLTRTVYCSRLLWVNTGDSLSLGELWGRGEQGARGRSVALQFGIAFGAGRRVAADGAGGRDQAARGLRADERRVG